ncbi:glutathione S-transferase family protein [Marinomonas epiphytica]
MILHDYLPSGNGYKIRLLCAQLGINYQLKEYDITQGETRTEDFLALSPNGKIPVLELENGHCLSESNAILLYLSERFNSTLMPSAPLLRAEVYKWLFWEQYSHEPNIAAVRFWLTHDAMTPLKEQILPERIELGNAALKLMDDTLVKSTYLVGEELSLADICLFAYTHVAEEGGAFDLANYPYIQRWIQTIEQQSWFQPITQAH